MFKLLFRSIQLCICFLSSFAAMGQTDVIWRTTGPSGGNWDWGSSCDATPNDGQWSYNTWGGFRQRPDCYGIHDVFFNGNGLNTMNLNSGSDFGIRRIIFNSGATTSRSLSTNAGRKLILTQNNGVSKIENLSSGSHSFNVDIDISGGTTEFNPINGDLIFSGNIANGNNFIDVYGNNGNDLIIGGVITGTGGLAIKQNSKVRFTGDQTYTGETYVEAGTLSLEGAASTNTITSDITISGGALEYGNTNDEQINDLSDITINSGSWDLGARIETVNSITATDGLVKIASGELFINTTTSFVSSFIEFSAASGSFVSSGLLELNGSFFNYLGATNSTNLVRISSGLSTTGSSSYLGNPSIGFAGAYMNLTGTQQIIDLASGADLDTEWGFTNGGITKRGAGNLILRAPSSYTGQTILEEGTITYETNSPINFASDLIFDGGALSLNGFSNVVSTLTVNSNSTIILGTGSHSLQFQNSSGESWDGSATLTIENWQGTPGTSGSNGRIIVGNDDTGLTPAQLTQIIFDGYPGPAEILLTGEVVPSTLGVAIFDSFDRIDNNTVGVPSSGGASWSETETASGTSARIESNQLRLQSNVAGRDFVSYDVSGKYATAFDGAKEDVEWRFNFETNRNNPTGFNSSNYGMAFILGSNIPDFTDSEAFGYAIVLGGSGDPDPVSLVKFTDGLVLNSNLTPIITVPTVDPNSRFSIAVSYSSCSNTWSLSVREDIDPNSSPISGNFPAPYIGSDNEFTSVDLNYFGALWNHGISGTSFAEFDNFYIPTAIFDAEYTWNGSANTDYQNPANWTPSRDCPRGRDRLVFNGSGGVDVTNVSDQEQIGQWILGTGIDLRVEDDPNTNLEPDVPSEIILTGGTGEDFVVPAGATMRFDCGSIDTPDALQFVLNKGSTADIDGTVVLQRSNSGSGPDHRIIGTDPLAIDVEGTIIAEDLASGWEPFGDNVSPGSVVFQAGSTYESYAGGSPFGSSGSTAQSIFNDESTYIHKGAHSFQTGGRAYANFVYDFTSDRNLLFGGNLWQVEDLVVLDSDLNITGATNGLEFPIEIRGNLEVAAGSAFNYIPINSTVESLLTFTGSTAKSVFGAGSISFNSNAVIVLNKDNAGLGLTFEKDLEFFNDVLILDGELQGSGVTMTMSGANSELLVNGDIYGTDVGFGQDLGLNINNSPVSISGSPTTVCRFYEIDVQAGNTFIINRPLIDVRYGTFTIGDGSTLQIDAADEAILGSSAAPFYGVNSELIYNSGAITERGAEWSTTSGAGYPVSLTIQNGTTVEITNSVGTDYGIQGDLNIGDASNGSGTLTMTDVTNYLQVEGDVNIGAGVTAGTLSLSSAVSGGDVRLRGDWNNNQNGTFNSNGRAVYFNGSAGDQHINKLGASTVEVFDYLIVEKTSGNLVIGTNTTEVDARGQFGGDALQLFDGNLDLNGKVFNLGKNGNATGMRVSNGLRQVFSLIPGAFFNIEGNNNKVISSYSSGTLEFDNQTTVTIAAGVDFGPAVTTINATLELLNGSFANGNAPFYGTDGVLEYNTGGNYDRRVEWDGTAGNPGYPNDVIIRNGTSVLAATSSGFNNRPMNLDRNLTIEAGGSLFLNGGSVNMNLPLIIGGDLSIGGGLSGSSTGGDIQLKGDWNLAATGSFFPNGCEVLFNGTSQQNYAKSAFLEFDDVAVNNPNGLLLLNQLVVNGNFDFIEGIVTSAFNLEQLLFHDDATVSNASNSSFCTGLMAKEGDDEFLFPCGDIDVDGNEFYQPVRMFFDPGEEAFTVIEVRYNAMESLNAGPFYDGSIGANGYLEEVGNCDYWFVDKPNPGDADPKMSFAYTNPLLEYCNVVPDPATLRIASWNGFQWSEISSAPSGNFIQSDVEINTPVTGGNYGEIAFTSGNQANILPITLLSFHAEVKDGLVHTNWVTASEVNNDFFTLERSKDGSSWEVVGTVDGAGDSNTELNYAYVDDAPYSGISYYRLRQTDFDGTTTISEPRAVEIRQGSAFGLDKAFRGQDGLNLVYRSTAPYVVVEIYDLLGKRIHGELIENYGNGFATIYPDLARGAYLMRLSHGSEMDAKKFVY